MVEPQAFADDDETTRSQIAAMIEAERVALAHRRQELEDCACKSGMFPIRADAAPCLQPAPLWRQA